MDQPVLEIEETLNAAHERSQGFWLLADLVLNGPRSATWAILREEGGEYAEFPSEAWAEFVDTVNRLGDAAGNTLAVEHTRLFAGLSEGSGPHPPFESSWHKGQAPGEVLALVTRTYAEAGFADIDLSAGPQDHLSVELKFMALLARREAEAWAAGEQEHAVDRQQQQRNFLERHLLSWVPRWADVLAQHTQEKVYWALARLLLVELNRAADAVA